MTEVIEKIDPMVATAMAAATIHAAPYNSGIAVLDGRHYGGTAQTIAAVKACFMARDMRDEQLGHTRETTHVVVARAESNIHGTSLDEDRLPQLAIHRMNVAIVVIECPFELEGSVLTGTAMRVDREVEAWAEEQLAGNRLASVVYVYDKQEEQP